MDILEVFMCMEPEETFVLIGHGRALIKAL